MDTGFSSALFQFSPSTFKKLSKYKNIVSKYVGCDKRSLALYRFMLAATIIGDLIDRHADLHSHYTDNGLAPRATYAHDWHPSWSFFYNPYIMSGGYWETLLLFLVHYFCAFCLLIGYKTTLFSWILWVFQNGIIARCFPVGHGGDMFFRCIMFWNLWLDLGACWSVDEALKPKEKERVKSEILPSSLNGREGHSLYDSPRILTVGTVAITLQITFLYVFSAFLKTHDWWQKDYTAAIYAMRLDFFRQPLGDFLLMFPEMVRFLTWGTLWWELWGPIFYFIPFFQAQFRLFGIMGFIAMHLGFALSLRLGVFFWITATAQLVLIPSWLWDEVIFRFITTRKRLDLRITYPSQCRFCTNSAKIYSNFFLLPQTQVIPSADLSHVQRDPENDNKEILSPYKKNETWVVTDGGYTYEGSRAIAAIIQSSPLLKIFSFLTKTPLWEDAWRFISNLVHPNHDNIALIKAKIAATSQPRPYSRRRTTKKDIVKLAWFITWNVFLVYLLYLVYYWNWSHVSNTTWRSRHSDDMLWLGVRLGIDQHWGMFAPRPPDTDFWPIIQAKLRNESEIELFRNEGMFNWKGSPFTWDPPNPWPASFGNHRWYKFWEAYLNFNAEKKLAFGRYLCREWNGRHHGDQEVISYIIWIGQEQHLLDGSSVRLDPWQAWSHTCF